MAAPTRDELCEKYLEDLEYEPYPVQEEALLAWFTTEQGVLVCAPTGMGKTLIAHAAAFEALHRGETLYYTTPLIALTEQKFRELQEAAVKWGFDADDVGLVTGNRRVNPDARVLVVVAEILLNRLLNPSAFDFPGVAAVVMDEFHNFADRERGIVWELTLAMLPEHVRLLLLSATVGNAAEFLAWLRRCHGKDLELVQSTDRRVPLTYHWTPDKFLNERVEQMAQGVGDERMTPALVFCFNREECWTVAEQLKGLSLLSDQQRTTLRAELEKYDWTQGVGPKLKQMLWRGVGVHHAGMLPRYRRLVEDLYQHKLLSVAVCTETLAAGINLPARSVVLTTLLKGPFGKKKLINASSAHQIFGRAGRPQFDDQGFVVAMAHEDDVRILRWREKYDSIPEHAKDPNLIKAKKQLWKKRPTRRENQQYWTEPQFQKVIAAPPNNLASTGPLPWRLLAYLLKTSPEVARVRKLIHKRLMTPKKLDDAEKGLERMLRALWEGGFVELEPAPPKPSETQSDEKKPAEPKRPGLLEHAGIVVANEQQAAPQSQEESKPYQAEFARPKPALDRLLVFRSVHPLYGAFLLDHLGIADRDERLQALESVLVLPRALLRSVRPPSPEEVPPGPLTVERLDPELIRRGLIVARVPDSSGDEDDFDDFGDEEEHEPPFADKLRMLFDATNPGVHDVQTQAVWAAGELLRFDGDFNKFVRTHNLVKQEGLIFRHLLRLILLCAEFAAVPPEDVAADQWQADLRDLAERLTASCRAVDPQSTDKAMEQAHTADVVEGESHADTDQSDQPEPQPQADWRDTWSKHWDELLDEFGTT